jgi:hypothetical protein
MGEISSGLAISGKPETGRRSGRCRRARRPRPAPFYEGGATRSWALLQVLLQICPWPSLWWKYGSVRGRKDLWIGREEGGEYLNRRRRDSSNANRSGGILPVDHERLLELGLLLLGSGGSRSGVSDPATGIRQSTPDDEDRSINIGFSTNYAKITRTERKVARVCSSNNSLENTVVPTGRLYIAGLIITAR